MEEISKCFVCQSKFQLSADKGSIYKNLDPSTWKVFCHYFYPPPLVGLLLPDSASSSSNPPLQSEPNNVDFSQPVFCQVCCQTISILCGLHRQLEFLKSQISQIVAEVSLNFVQIENHDDEDEGNKSSNSDSLSSPERQSNKMRKHQECNVDNRVYSMRRCIRQRYQPVVCIARSNIDIQKQSSGSQIISQNNLDVAAASSSSPFLILSDFEKRKLQSLNQQDEDEDDDSLDQLDDDNMELESDTEQNLSEHEDILQKMPNEMNKNPIKVQTKEKVNEKSRDDQDKDKDKLSVKIGWGGRKPPDKRMRFVGEHICEYDGKWRLERRRDEGGKTRWHCLTCSMNHQNRGNVTKHIRVYHIKEPELRATARKVQKIDENNFLYDDTYTFQKVQEPNGTFFKCGVCSTLFNTYDGVRSHIKRYHVEGKKFACDECDYSSVRKDYLLNHKASHGQVKPYICEKCGKGFKTKDSLQMHMTVHSGKNYECECGLKFSHSGGLLSHRKRVNHVAPKVGPTPEAPFVAQRCPICKKEFVSLERLRKHVCKVKEKRPCDWCWAYSSGSLARVRKHKREKCPERFKFNKLDPDEGPYFEELPDP